MIRRGKNDTEQAGRTVAISRGEHPETCPVLAIRAWIGAAKLTSGSGSIFRTINRHGTVSGRPLHPRSIAKILRRAIERAGLDPAHLSPHSLRVGMVSQSYQNGAQLVDIARTTGHRSMTMVRHYIRDADLFRDNALKRLGL